MNQRDQKTANLESILRLVRVKGPISQADIAHRLSLQPSSVSNLVRWMKSRGIVAVVGKGESRSEGGRRADLLALNPDYGFVSGMYVRNDELLFRVVDFSEAVLGEHRCSTIGLSRDEVIDLIRDEHAAQKSRYGDHLGIGVAVSSVVTNQGDIVVSSHFDRTIPHLLESIAGDHPAGTVSIENDANCCALHDYMYNRDRFETLIHLMVYSEPFTIGAGIVLNGALYRGSGGAAGEILDELMVKPGNGRIRPETVVSLCRFLCAFLDPDAVLVSTDFVDQESVAALNGALAGAGGETCTVECSGGNDAAVTGASMLAMNLHLKRLITEG